MEFNSAESDSCPKMEIASSAVLHSWALDDSLERCPARKMFLSHPFASFSIKKTFLSVLSKSWTRPRVVGGVSLCTWCLGSQVPCSHRRQLEWFHATDMRFAPNKFINSPSSNE